MTNDDTRQRQPYRSTHLITSVANLAGLRSRMLRAAFRAGLADRNTGEGVSETAEWGGIGSMIGAGAVLAENAAKEGLNHGTFAAAAIAFGTLGAGTLAARTFGRITKEQAGRTKEFIRKDPLAAMHDVLGQQQIWDEMDANLLGKGIESLSSYIKRNADDLLTRPDLSQAAQNLQAITAAQAEGTQARMTAKLEEAQAARLVADYELRRSIAQTWPVLERCVTFAYAEGMMRPGDTTARMVDALARPAWQGLCQLGLRQPRSA